MSQQACFSSESGLVMEGLLSDTGWTQCGRKDIVWISFRVHLLSLSLSLFFWSVFFPFTLMESFWRRVSCPTDRHAHRHMCFSVLSFGEEKHDSRLHLNVVIMWIYKAFSHDSCHDFSEPLNTSILCLFDLDMKSASGIITEVQFYVYIYI